MFKYRKFNQGGLRRGSTAFASGRISEVGIPEMAGEL
jgi:hypothetical protein